MKYRYCIVDVFSRLAFGGNQLAVVFDASGISTLGMQKIAREFNFAETTFVFPVQQADDRFKVRIFTPAAEVAFAGHPTVGTACALVMLGHAGVGDRHALVLEEGIGPIAVDVDHSEGMFNATMNLSVVVEQPSGAPGKHDLAAVLSLDPGDVLEVFFAGVGLPFCLVRLVSREAVDRAAIDNAAWTRLLAQAWSPHVFFFAGDLENDAELYARMCAPALGVEEDPATGSACAALVGAIAHRPEFAGAWLRFSIRQGVAMGRQSDIEARARTAPGGMTCIHVGGATSFVASGEIEVQASLLESQ